MKTITEKELLDYHFSQINEIAKSQLVDIDENYFLIQDGKKEEPEFIFEDNFNTIRIFVKYNTTPKIELSFYNLKYILRDNKMYQFDKVVK